MVLLKPETNIFPSTVAGATWQRNRKRDFDSKCLIYFALCKVCENNM